MHEVVASPLTNADILMRIFEKRCSVIVCKGISVHGKMYGNEIHNDTDFILVAGIDKCHQLTGCSVTRGRCEEPGILIAP